jgi:transposase
VLEVRQPFAYQYLAEKADKLQCLGMSAAAIARALGVTDKTIAKALRFARRKTRNPSESRANPDDDTANMRDYGPDEL